MNSAEYAAEQARAAYVASLPVPQQAEFHLEQAGPAMARARLVDVDPVAGRGDHRVPRRMALGETGKQA